MPRVYDTSTYKKHKRGGWGAPCPEHQQLSKSPQDLLDTGVEVDGAIYNVDGEYALRAFTHEPDKWHGHPLAWSRLPNEARKALIEAGRLDDATYRKAIRKGWGREFEE